MPELEEATEQTRPLWWGAPEDELPALLPVSELLAVTDHVAVALTAVAAYRDGIEFRIDRRLRRNGSSAREWNEMCSTFMEHMPYFGPVDIGGRLRFGIVLGDGEKVLADPLPFAGGGDPMEEPRGHTLNRQQQGGGGDGNTYSGSDHLWLWPAPPEGAIELVMQWPALGIQETRVMLDGTAMRELTQRARPFWP